MKQRNDYSDYESVVPELKNETNKKQAVKVHGQKPKRVRKPDTRYNNVDIQPEVELLSCCVPGYN